MNTNEQIKRINIIAGYNGAIKIKATTETGKVMVIEVEEVEEYLLKAIDSKGYTSSLKPRQQYERLVINK